MGLSLQTDYALRLLMFLAAHGERTSIGDVATFFGISRDHLAKASMRLASAGLIRAIRGVGGGIELAKSPSDIGIGEVIELFEGRAHLLDCVPVENICVIQPDCKLRNVLAKAEEVQREFLAGVRLSDVVTSNKPLVQLVDLTRDDIE